MRENTKYLNLAKHFSGTLITIDQGGCPVEVEMGEGFFPAGVSEISAKKYIVKSVRVKKLDAKHYRVATFKKGKTYSNEILSDTFSSA